MGQTLPPCQIPCSLDSYGLQTPGMGFAMNGARFRFRCLKGASREKFSLLLCFHCFHVSRTFWLAWQRTWQIGAMAMDKSGRSSAQEKFEEEPRDPRALGHALLITATLEFKRGDVEEP